MPQTALTTNSTSAPGTDDLFLDLLCANEDLLRAEFDEIIAAHWTSHHRRTGAQR